MFRSEKSKMIERQLRERPENEHELNVNCEYAMFSYKHTYTNTCIRN